MLIFRKYGDVKPYIEQLREAGFGFSVLDERSQAEIIDLQSFRRMYADWGWSGDPSERPDWML